MLLYVGIKANKEEFCILVHTGWQTIISVTIDFYKTNLNMTAII